MHDSHFNLVVSGDSDLATLGSLSYRFNIGPIIKTVNIEKDKSMGSKQLEKEVEECNDDDINAVKSKLKKYKEIWG